ncbi:MAG: F-type H+-transporting ATPase subunit a [Chloroflexi bacterium]|nr:MAG: F-type H+-transporting ATPase subunit a [Chloroflexota bacterium]
MKLLQKPKLLLAIIVFGALFVIGLAGGALGDAFGLGFLGAPIAALQLPAEPISSEPNIGGFHITNTMITTWASIVILMVLGFVATRKIKEVPTGFQNVFEVIIEYFQKLGEGISGKRSTQYIPLVMTIFLFILVANWIGVLPGFGTIGWIETPEDLIHHAEEQHKDLSQVKLNVFNGSGDVGILGFGSVSDTVTAEEWEHDHNIIEDGKQAGILIPFLRSANTDINTTLAIALVAMFFVHFWALRTLGFRSHAKKYINFKQGPIWFAVGILELISEVGRVISFTFRLFGNIFAGEVLLVAMAFLIPIIGIMPFIGLELFVGLIQAYVFSMLTLVFASVAGAAHDDH